MRVEQAALTIQQTVFDMQPPTSVRDEEDWESLPDSSAMKPWYAAINRAWLARFGAASETSISDSSTYNGSYVTEEESERSIFESSTLKSPSAAEMNEDEIVDAMVAAFLPKLRGGRAIVRQKALAVNRELGINPTRVSMTVAEAALATTNLQMGTAVTMEEVEAMRPIDLSFPEEEEDEQEEVIAAFIRKVKEQNEKEVAALP